jgi:hypothetical protein
VIIIKYRYSRYTPAVFYIWEKNLNYLSYIRGSLASPSIHENIVALIIKSLATM